MEASPGPVYYTPNESEQFFRKKNIITIAFTIGLLLFLLPFAELRCNNIGLVRNTGIGLAIGTEWRSSLGTGLDNGKESVTGDANRKGRKELSNGPNIFAIAAAAAGLIGLFVAFNYGKYRSLLCMSAGILAAIMLIAMMIQLRISVRSLMNKALESGDKDDTFGNMGMGMSQMIKLHFTIWYYISLVSFITAAFFGYKQHRIELDDAIRAAHQFEFQQKEDTAPQS